MTGLQLATPRLDSTPLVHRLRDYVMLAKPRVVVMVMAVTAVGYYLGPARRAGLAAPAAPRTGNGLGCWRHLGPECLRRAHRGRHDEPHRAAAPADGRLEPAAALRFGLAAVVVGCAYLLLMVHPLCAP